MEPGQLASGISAILAAATLVLGIAGLITRRRRARPWLAVLFGANARYGDVSRDTLKAVQPVDIVLLLLAGATYAGFWPGPAAEHKVWMSLAIGQPLLAAGYVALVGWFAWLATLLLG